MKVQNVLTLFSLLYSPHFLLFLYLYSTSLHCIADDNRRLGVAVEQYNNKLSMVMDANGVLNQV